ncbi:MAG: 3-oxoacyl-ACP synthase, partial [Chitinophagia bacterium]|nr:3-oxoacyl-ACP synthase [Chitinophagia bacterium]
KQALENITPLHRSADAQPGSVVHTEAGKYYISIGAGKLQIDGITYYTISPDAPVAAQILGKKAGDSFTLNGKSIKILEVI